MPPTWGSAKPKHGSKACVASPTSPAAPDHPVPIVVITQDRSSSRPDRRPEIIGPVRGAESSGSISASAVKIVPNDFTAQPEASESWNAASFTIYLKAEELAQFRDGALSLASELRNAGYPGAADAVVKAVTFVRTIACLPIPLAVFREHLDYMERAGAVSDYVAAKYRYLGVADTLRKAERDADSLGDSVHAFRERTEAMISRYAGGGEVSELIRELIAKAVNKANRTIVAFRDRVVLSAVSEWLADREDIDQAKLGSKLILTTTEALASTLSATSRGAPIDSLFLVNPMVRHFERIVLSLFVAAQGRPDRRRRNTRCDHDRSGSRNASFRRSAGRAAQGRREKPGSVRGTTDILRFRKDDFPRVCSRPYPRFHHPRFRGGDRYEGDVIELRTEDGYTAATAAASRVPGHPGKTTSIRFGACRRTRWRSATGSSCSAAICTTASNFSSAR